MGSLRAYFSRTPRRLEHTGNLHHNPDEKFQSDFYPLAVNQTFAITVAVVLVKKNPTPPARALRRPGRRRLIREGGD